MTDTHVVLVVDDNANNRFTLSALLSRLPDCTVVEADSGEAALLATLDREIHLILLDVQMPGMDGFDTARHLQMTERTRHIPLVFVTAVFKAEEFARRGFALGAVDYLTKPIDDNLLLSRVRLYQHLHRREHMLQSALHLVGEREAALITAKGLAEAASNELRKLGRAVEQSPHSLFITDTDGIIEYVNPVFTESTGYSASEAIGQPPRLFKSGKTPLATYQHLWKTILAGDIWRGELINRNKDGTFYWVSSSIAPVHDVSGKVSHFVCMHVNISEKVQAQEDLRRAKEAAEAANRAKSTFLANMSHELRTPLNAVIGFSRLLSRSSHLDATEKNNLEIINRSGNHLLTLINDVLDLSKIEAGQVELLESEFALPTLLDDVIAMLKQRAEQAGLSLSLETHGLPGGIRTDEVKLRQILINLIGNAIKFTQTGGVSLSVAGAPAAAGRVRLAFAVSDTGIGIAAEDQQKIFEPFVQMVTHATTAGTGLGLSITRRYIAMLGGELSVTSTPGQGSTFGFSLDVPGISVEASSAAIRGAVSGLAAADRGTSILIVEDNPDGRALLKALLEPLGFAVSAVEDGAVAVAQVEKVVPDLILMDWRMPTMDGLEATRRIRALPLERQPKIVMLTASALEEQRMEALDTGIDDYLRKPADETELFAVLEAQLGIRLERASQETAAVPPAPTFTAALTPAALAELPEDVRADLRQAVEELNSAKLAAVLARIAATHPQLARGIDAMVAAFKYSDLWQLLKK